jgi:hypothetical protein
MDKHSLIEGLRILERQMVNRLDSMDEARRILLQQVENEPRDEAGLKASAHALHEEIMRMRELCQQIIYKSTMLTKTDGGDQKKGDFKQSFDSIEKVIK